MVSTKILVGDQIEILEDNAWGTDEKKGTRLVVTNVNVDEFYVNASTWKGKWSFTLESIKLNKIRHIPKMSLPGDSNYTFKVPKGLLVNVFSNSPQDTSLPDLHAGYGDGFYPYWDTPEKEKEPEKPKIKCECGMSTVAGHEGDNPEQHSSWCPIYKEKK